MARLRHEYLVLSGIVLPFLTILAVFWSVAASDLPGILAPFVLIAGPLLAIAGTYAVGLLGGVDVPIPDVFEEYLGPHRQQTFRDEIPREYEAAFSHETLDEPTGEDRDAGAFVRYYLVYLATLPVHTLAFILVT